MANSPPELKSTKALISMLEHKHIDCAKDIQRLGTKLLNTYQNWLINNRDMNPSEALDKANDWVNMILDEQGKESTLTRYGEKKGFVRGPGILRKTAAQFRALTARNSQIRPRNNTARAPAASAARNSAPSANEGNSAPLLARATNNKGATRTSVLNRLKGIFGSKKNTRKNLLNVNLFTKDIVERMSKADDMTELNYLYNEIRGDLEKLAPKSKNKKTVNAAISKLEGAFIKRRRELEGEYKNTVRAANPFANETSARIRQQELLRERADLLGLGAQPRSASSTPAENIFAPRPPATAEEAPPPLPPPRPPIRPSAATNAAPPSAAKDPLAAFSSEIEAARNAPATKSQAPTLAQMAAASPKGRKNAILRIAAAPTGPNMFAGLNATAVAAQPPPSRNRRANAPPIGPGALSSFNIGIAPAARRPAAAASAAAASAAAALPAASAAAAAPARPRANSNEETPEERTARLKKLPIETWLESFAYPRIWYAPRSRTREEIEQLISERDYLRDRTPEEKERFIQQFMEIERNPPKNGGARRTKRGKRGNHK